MSFGSQVIGTLTLNKGTLQEIGESEDLTKNGWLLLILSSLIAGLSISAYFMLPLMDSGISMNNLILGLIIPPAFCFLFGFDMAWTVVAIKKRYSKRQFFTLDGFNGLKEPEFQKAIRLAGYASVVLVLSALFIVTGMNLYQFNSPNISIENANIGTFLIALFLGPPGWLGGWLSPFIFPYVMILNPIANPVIIFLLWQAIIFLYAYNINTTDKKEKDENVKGTTLGILLFNIFWITVFIAVLLMFVCLFAQSD